MARTDAHDLRRRMTPPPPSFAGERLRSHDHRRLDLQRRLRHQRHADLPRPQLEGPSHRGPAVQQPHGQRHRRRRESGDTRRLGLCRRRLGCRAQHARVHRRPALLPRARPAGGLPQPAGRQPAGLFLEPAVEDRRLRARRHAEARLGRAARGGHQGLRSTRHGRDPGPLLRQAERHLEGRERRQGGRQQHRRLADRQGGDQRADRDRQRGRPRKRVGPSHHRRRPLP